MLTPETGRELVATPGQESAGFSIDAADTAHVMAVLRDTIYSDKVLAVLREYGANAQDAHLDPRAPESSRGRPIRVRLPTHAEPTLEVTDWGPGLSHDDALRLFTCYGASTKRGQADATGYIGIGCKSAFCYSDSFAVVSRHGGRRRTYAVVLDASDRGEMRLVDDAPGDPGDSGLTIRVPVRPEDVGEFRSKSASVFRFYEPQPDVDAALPDGRCDVVTTQRGWVAVMGCVGYPVDVDQFAAHEYVKVSGGVARFPLGALSVSASREALRYDERTRAALAERLTQLVDAHAAALATGAAALDDWGKRLRFAGMGLFAPLLREVEFPGVYADKVVLRPARPSTIGEPPVLRVSRREVPVSPRARVVFVDDRRALAGYGLGEDDFVVRPQARVTEAAALDALRQAIESGRLAGIPVVRSSSLSWERPSSGRASPPRARGTRRSGALFELLPDSAPPGVAGRRSRRDRDLPASPSSRWRLVDREPSDSDVFVELDRFCLPPEFWGVLATVRAALAVFGVEHPPVYGYRRAADVRDAPPPRGTPYAAWAAGLCDRLAAEDPRVAAALRAEAWSASRLHWARKAERAAAAAATRLGAAHPVARLAAEAAAAIAPSVPARARVAAGDLARLAGRPAGADLSALAPYPLAAREGVDFLADDDLGDWLDYVAAMDAAAGRKAPAETGREEQQ